MWKCLNNSSSVNVTALPLSLWRLHLLFLMCSFFRVCVSSSNFCAGGGATKNVFPPRKFIAVVFPRKLFVAGDATFWGGCCLWLELDGKRIAFTGDNLFANSSDKSQDGHEAVVARNSAIFEEGYLYGSKYLKDLKRIVKGLD